MSTFDLYRIALKGCDLNCLGCKRVTMPHRKNVAGGRAAKRRARRLSRKDMLADVPDSSI
jgi:pyruvate-formate lyase-activating enzyme